jgi:Ca2+-binding EF-hand superfamily protein
MVDREGEERITFNNMKKMAAMLKLNLTDDQVQEAIQAIAGKGKQQITWEQFNAFLGKKMEKKNKN